VGVKASNNVPVGMQTMLKKILLAGAALAIGANVASAKDLKSIGISLGSMGNPFFVALSKGAEFEAKKTNPNVKITTVGFDYDLGKQNTQIDNFIAAGVDLILLNPGDPNAIAPAIRRAQAAGIVVVAVDTAAKGANATVETNNIQAGTIACEFLVEKMGGKGDMIILNGPQVSSVIERVNGCKEVLAKHPGIKLISFDQDAKGSRDGGLAVMQSLLTRFIKVDGVFAINDPTAIGGELAAKQMQRTNFPITAVDGAPDAEAALKDPNSPQFVASASQDPFLMARLAVQEGVALLNGDKPEKDPLLMDSKLVTRDNVADYKGWTAAR
jgi:ribose transport system substrate-binding protein